MRSCAPLDTLSVLNQLCILTIGLLSIVQNLDPHPSNHSLGTNLQEPHTHRRIFPETFRGMLGLFHVLVSTPLKIITFWKYIPLQSMLFNNQIKGKGRQPYSKTPKPWESLWK